MLFRDREFTQSYESFDGFAYSMRQKARTPIRQSINFSSEALTKAAIRRVVSEPTSSRVYGEHGTVKPKPVGHLLSATA